MPRPHANRAARTRHPKRQKNSSSAFFLLLLCMLLIGGLSAMLIMNRSDNAATDFAAQAGSNVTDPASRAPKTQGAQSPTNNKLASQQTPPAATKTPEPEVRLVKVEAATNSAGQKTSPSIASGDFETKIKPFFATYCNDCHGEKKQKAKRRFDTLRYPITDEDMLIDFQDALDLLNLGEMPPEDETQPDNKDKLAVIDWLTKAIADKQAASKGTSTQTVLRRLNRREYLHTVSDLLNMNLNHFDPTEAFPSDQKVHHLDNQGEALVTSGYLLDQYLEAADKIISKALPSLEKPSAQTWHFTGGFYQGELTKFFSRDEYKKHITPISKQYLNVANKLEGLQQYQRNELKRIPNMLRKFPGIKTLAEREKLKTQITSLFNRAIKDQANTEETQLLRKKFQALIKIGSDTPSTIQLHDHPRSERHNGSYGYVSYFEEGVPHDGYYDITLRLETKYFQQQYRKQYKKNYTGIRFEAPIEIAIIPGDATICSLHLPQDREPKLFRKTIPNQEGIQEVKARIWLDQGATPRFIWENGGSRTRQAYIQAGKHHAKKNKATGFKSNQEYLYYGFAHAQLPHIRIHDVKLNGPHFDSWPTSTQKKLLGGSTSMASRETLKAFLSQAYRRPATDEEISRIEKVVQLRREQGQSALDAYRDGLKVALCSPSFIYLDEPAVPDESGEARLSPYAIASRLSYFLWSSMPDAKLFELSDSGVLLSKESRIQQVKRMLKDKRSDRFISAFLDSWLTLSDLGSTAPDKREFNHYYQGNLEWAMRQETELFTRYILENGKSIMHFLDSDYTFANHALSVHYGLKNKVKGHQFQKVSVAGSQRGGLMGHASVLTVTANGVDTSPVVRGIWLLENILGTPPPPPPPDVEPLDPDIRGAKTIRDKLLKHRTDPACAECHRKIDPLGFAMENFNAIGGWRDSYHVPKSKRVKVDASGHMPGGKAFQSFNDFKQVMTSQKDKFAKALTKKLLAYAMGREITIHDRPEVDAIVNDLKANDMRFNYLIERIVASDLFIKP